MIGILGMIALIFQTGDNFCKCLRTFFEYNLNWHSRSENLKKSRAKKLMKSNKWISQKKLYFPWKLSEILILMESIQFFKNFFPVQKLIFVGHFWNCKKWDLLKNNFFVKWISFISRVFVGLDFFKFSGPVC